MPDDRIQREIEDILNRLDEFVPDENVANRVRRRSASAAANVVRALIAPIARISLGQVMFWALVIIVVAFFGMRIHPLYARWVLIGGVILFLTSFGLSFFSRSAPATTEQRWRGRRVELDEASLGERLRAWWNRRRSRR